MGAYQSGTNLPLLRKPESECEVKEGAESTLGEVIKMTVGCDVQLREAVRSGTGSEVRRTVA